MKINTIGFQYFRGVGSEAVYLDWTKRVHVLIGANNAGKSSIVAAIQRLFDNRLELPIPDEIDRYRRAGPERGRVTLDIDWSDEAPDDVAVRGGRFVYDRIRQEPPVSHPFQKMGATELIPYMAWLLNLRFGRTYTAEEVVNSRNQCALKILEKAVRLARKVLTVPAYRQIVDGDPDFTGRGLVLQLGKWQNPAIGKDDDRKRFDAIQTLLRHLLDLPEATIDVPRESPNIVVSNEGLRLPIQNYGTGVHQVLILATAVLDAQSALVSIEEPEIYLHPRLQRDLLRFLIEKTNSSYLITTHSAGFLSRPSECDVIRVRSDGTATLCTSVRTSRETLEVLGDLGISAADVLQARFVIWVEGPSDAIYLRRWLEISQGAKDEAEKLIEGIDFAMMFYGGKCLSHITFDGEAEDNAALAQDDVSRLLDLLRINQNSAILLDSDRRDAAAGQWEQKDRIAKECETIGLQCWITEGREIENYLPTTSIERCYEAAGVKLEDFALGQWEKIDEALARAAGDQPKSRWEYSRSKPNWAHRIAPFVDDLDVLDLRARIEDLVGRIHRAR